APHVGKLDRLSCERNVVHFLHNCASVKRTPSEANSARCFYLIEPRNRKVCVGAPDGEPEIDCIVCPHCHPQHDVANAQKLVQYKKPLYSITSSVRESLIRAGRWAVSAIHRR